MNPGQVGPRRRLGGRVTVAVVEWTPDNKHRATPLVRPVLVSVGRLASKCRHGDWPGRRPLAKRGGSILGCLRVAHLPNTGCHSWVLIARAVRAPSAPAVFSIPTPARHAISHGPQTCCPVYLPSARIRLNLGLSAVRGRACGSHHVRHEAAQGDETAGVAVGAPCREVVSRCPRAARIAGSPTKGGPQTMRRPGAAGESPAAGAPPAVTEVYADASST